MACAKLGPMKDEVQIGSERREPVPIAPMRTLDSPEIAASISHEVTRDGWTVFGTWYLNRGDATLPAGPERIQIFLSPEADEETRRRGLNSTVLRRTIEPALVELIRGMTSPGANGSSLAELLPEAAQRSRDAYERTAQVRESLFERIRETLASLPRPRADPEGYYGTLLDTYEVIKASGLADPVGVLQEALSPDAANPVPRGTVLSRLRKARKIVGKPQQNDL
jgi:hypothetical protein